MDSTNKMPHLRQLLDTPQCYSHLAREERNFAALLYAELIRSPGLEAFLALVDRNLVPADTNDVAVFFEYAHLRDLWAHFGGRTGTDCNTAYRLALQSLLDPPKGLFESLTTTESFNRFFIGERKISSDYIQMPSRWNQDQFDLWRSAFGEADADRSLGTEFAQRCCTLKWAFNAKPDIVIHLNPTQAICVEIKFDSPESRYSVDLGAPGAKWGLTQTDVQRYVLQDVLGFDTRFVFLSRTGRSHLSTKARGNSVDLSWEEVRGALKTDGEGRSHDLPFAKHLWSLAAAPVTRGRR